MSCFRLSPRALTHSVSAETPAKVRDSEQQLIRRTAPTLHQRAVGHDPGRPARVRVGCTKDRRELGGVDRGRPRAPPRAGWAGNAAVVDSGWTNKVLRRQKWPRCFLPPALRRVYDQSNEGKSPRSCTHLR